MHTAAGVAKSLMQKVAQLIESSLDAALDEGLDAEQFADALIDHMHIVVQQVAGQMGPMLLAQLSGERSRSAIVFAVAMGLDARQKARRRG
jgi:hypothetical protein